MKPLAQKALDSTKKTLILERKPKPPLIFEKKPDPVPRKVDIRSLALKNTSTT